MNEEVYRSQVRQRLPSFHEDSQTINSPSSIKKVLSLGKQSQKSIQVKNISSEMMKIIRRYLHVASSEWETQIGQNNTLILKRRHNQKYSSSLSDQNQQLNQNRQQHMKVSSNQQKLLGNQKTEATINNYEQLRDPRFWIQRSLSEQIGNVKGLNSELVDYKFKVTHKNQKDEDIRLASERNNQPVGLELRKVVIYYFYCLYKLYQKQIVPSRQNSELPYCPSPSQTIYKQNSNKLLDIKVLKDQWNISRPNYSLENSKDEELVDLHKQHIVQDFFTQFKNVHQNSYQKNLKTAENIISPKRKMLPKVLNSQKRQNNNANYGVQEKSYSEEDTHNFIFPQNIYGGNSVEQLRQNIQSPNQNSKILKLLNIQKLNHQSSHKQNRVSLLSQTPQQMYYNFNSASQDQKQNRYTTKAISAYQAIQKLYNNQDKMNRFMLETIQLTPISKCITKGANGNQKVLRIISEGSIANNSSVQEQILGYKLHQPFEEQDNESEAYLNDLYKQEENGNNIGGDKMNIENDYQQQKEGENSKQNKNESRQKDYKIRKFQIKKTDPSINALGKSHPIYYEQKYIIRLQKEKQFTVRISAYRDFLQAMNFSNKLYVSIPEEKQNHPIYKAYVGKGNNQMLIRMVIKQRWWWIVTDQKEDANINLVWTQLRKNDILQTIKSLKQELTQARIQRQTSSTSILAAQQSPSNNLNQQPQIFSPSNSQTSFTQQFQTIAQQTSTQSLFGSQSESTTDESTIISASNLNLQSNPKQVVKLGRQAQFLKKLTNQSDFQALNNLFSNRNGKKFDQTAFSNVQVMSNLIKDLECKQIKEPVQLKIHNHLQDNFHLSNKKALFYNMRSYYESNQQNPFEFIPLTFHIQEGKKDKEYSKFVAHFNQLKELANNYSSNQNSTAKKEQNIWIVKPGEITNRGSGIKVLSDLDQIEQIVESNEFHKTGMRKTFIIQKYIEYPLLYFKRKFDIRCYYLLTTTNGYLKGYWYQDGYIRTASKEFTTKNLGKMIHLTNDAVQKKDDQYGKYEKGNKVSYDELDKYITSLQPEKDFYNSILPQMKEIARDTMKAVYGKIDPDKKETTFEVFGLDFMIDENLKVWLIEVNTNPALDICCPLLSKIIPSMIENTFRIAIDPLFPPPSFSNHKNFNFDNILENNKYELIFDEVEDSKLIKMTGKDTNLNWQMIEEELDEDEEDIIPE
ncbi:hypothetical protein ABPG74_016840 [Tetrahymena malaccensis]